jgi:hypothetical protein
MINQIKKIKENAELVKKQLDIEYNEESIKFLEEFIERQKNRMDTNQIDGLINTLGSFLGECIIENFGGSWEEDEHGLTIKFDEKNGVYPFSKIRKQFENGLEDSIFSFYTSIPIIFKPKK